jgi:O-succinylhomoserine sulfhydrylase
MDGQGRVLGGVVVGKKELIHEIYLFCRATGPALSPFNAWVLSKSLETLSLRMEKHASNALELCNSLLKTEGIKNVRYPFLLSHPQHSIAQKQMKNGGGLLTFEMNNGYNQAVKFIDALKMCSLTANLGDTRTIVTHPASSTHSKLTEEERLQVGITQGLIRVSVGLEDPEDIATDLVQAIAASK